MGSTKPLVMLGFLLVALVLISSHAAAAEGQPAGKKAEEQRKRDPIEESKAGCPYGCMLFWKGHCWVCKPKPHPPTSAEHATHAAAAEDTIGDGKEVHAEAVPHN